MWVSLTINFLKFPVVLLKAHNRAKMLCQSKIALNTLDEVKNLRLSSIPRKNSFKILDSTSRLSPQVNALKTRLSERSASKAKVCLHLILQYQMICQMILRLDLDYSNSS